MSDHTQPDARAWMGSTWFRLLVVAGLAVGFMWTANSGAVDYQEVLWSKPGRVWAVGAGLAVFFGGLWAVTTTIKRRGGQLRMVPLLAAALIAGGLAYGFDLRGQVLDTPCRKGQAANLDGVCTPIASKPKAVAG